VVQTTAETMTRRFATGWSPAASLGRSACQEGSPTGAARSFSRDRFRSTPSQNEGPLSTEENKRLLIRWPEEVFNQRNPDAVDELAAADVVWHGPHPAPDCVGTEAIKRVVRDFLAAFPDLRIAGDELLAEGDKTVHRATTTGTHRGEFLGIPPTGRRVTLTSMSICRWAGGKLVEGWDEADLGGLKERLKAES
jgi:predicted ester cyclase